MALLDFARSWHATPAERAADYPAHRYATAPYRSLLRAVDIAAPPAVVYRWLCQLKVAPYSYDWIDNPGRRSPRTLTPGVDRLAVGERVMTIFRLVEFVPDRQLTVVARSRARAVFGPLAITYQVSPTATGSRLVCCVDHTSRSWPGRRRADLLAVGDLVMMRRQLLNLRALAEAPAA